MAAILNVPSEAQELGAPQAEYAGGKTGQVLGLIFSALMAIGSLLFALVMAIVTLLEGDPQLLCLTGIGFLFALLGVWWFISTVRNWGRRVLLFADGLTYTVRNKTQVIRWDDIAAVYQQVTRHYRNGIYTGTSHHYTIQLNDGQRFKFNDALKNVEALGNTIQQECTRRLFPRMATVYNAGQPVSFGPLSLSKAGISKGKETLPWDQIKGIKLDKGIVSIKKEGGWFNWSSVTVPQIPNVFVFTGMVDQIVGINKGRK